MAESLLALNVRPPASSRDKNFADAVLEPLALALRCPRGRLQLAHAAAKSVDACADHFRSETLLALLTGAGADRLELAPRVGLPVDGAARGPGHAEPAHGVLPAAAARGEAQVICTKVLYAVGMTRANAATKPIAISHHCICHSLLYTCQ